MNSTYKELQALAAQSQEIANKVKKLTEIAFQEEKEKVIQWIKTKMSVFDITEDDIVVKIKTKEKKYRKKLDESKDFHGRSFQLNSKETRQKMSAAKKGVKFTEEHKKNISIALVSRATYVQPVSINGVKYNSISAATKHLNLSHSTISKRCNNSHTQFKDWYYVTSDNVYQINKQKQA